MKKPIVGTLLGAAVFFFWGFVSWMFLPWHEKTIKTLPEEQLISDTLKTVITEPGFYSFPSGKTSQGRMDQKEWSEKYKRGPVGVLAFSLGGREPMGPVNYICAIICNLILASVTMLILCLSRDRVQSILPRALLVACVGIAASAAVHLSFWNWFNFPWNFTWVNSMDTVVSFLLLGLAEAPFVPRA